MIKKKIYTYIRLNIYEVKNMRLRRGLDLFGGLAKSLAINEAFEASSEDPQWKGQF